MLRHICKVAGSRRWDHPYLPLERIGESKLGYRFLYRHVTSFIDPHEGMAAHEQELKNNDCEAEGIMIRCPNNACELLTLKLGRRVLRDADAT
jgi:hypothetical protein